MLDDFPFPGADALEIPRLGLALWLDATYGVTLDGASSRVTSWTPRVGTSVASQTTAAQMPTLTTLNGLPAISFDGVDDFFNLSNAFTVGDQSTCIVVFKLNSMSSSQPIFTSSLMGAYSLVVHLSGSPRLQAVGGSPLVSGNPTISQGQPAFVGVTLDRASRAWTLIASYASNLSGVLDAPAFSSMSDRIGIQPGAKLDGTIAELFLYNRALTVTELRIAGSLVCGKWGAIRAL